MTEPSEPGGKVLFLSELAGARAARRAARQRKAHEHEIALGRLLGKLDETTVRAIFGDFERVSRALAELLSLAPAARDAWIENRAWGETEALALAGQLLEEADELPLLERLELARLAARVAVRCPIPAGDALAKARAEDVLGRAGLLEVRVLRRRGRLEEALARFAELTAMFAEDPSVFYFWLTLYAEDALTRGLRTATPGG